MAPKQGSKRAAAAAASEEPAAKRLADLLKQQGVSKSHYKAVVEALEHPLACDVPEGCRRMLVAALPLSLCVPQDHRDAYQSATVDMIGELVDGVTSKLQEALSVECERRARVEGTRAGLGAKASEVAASVAEAAEVVEALQAEASEASETLLAAEVALSRSRDAQLRAAAGLGAAAADKELVEACAAGAFAKLRDGDWVSAEEAAGHWAALEALTPKLALEDSLALALPGSLAKKRPAERGAFDHMVVSQLEQGLACKVQELGSALEAGAAIAAEQVAATEAAARALEMAEQAQQAATARLRGAQERQLEAAAALAAAKVELSVLEEAHEKAASACSERQLELELFRDYTAVCYTVLRDRVSAEHRKALAEAAAAQATLTIAEAAELKTLQAGGSEGSPSACSCTAEDEAEGQAEASLCTASA